jgi:hypothetical protein|uniref:Uncharacterized protein n=1 Tax=Eutreptiella gymnastica TaxID=73025 RepID=A0A7S4LMU5_9EUGL|eukprot:CAMPEP_0174304230 /NCGR_PEP_ID=MMETSP0809-20121228/60654_1 /TAXON_ID=73025 ORGANISM="Eutreptiella gymnastica-like, Strain CCMP1594" /NCGR_SAMPLE_ID=MMETSP0809 /ASSEMBLY_ACC=CAM_ASM_000658 /LENGTH=196 /DNA_ID=CAMNT_0015410397 /DNA_START=59 /DNA_END=649 /DNA_ORIENTATION=+
MAGARDPAGLKRADFEKFINVCGYASKLRPETVETCWQQYLVNADVRRQERRRRKSRTLLNQQTLEDMQHLERTLTLELQEWDRHFHDAKRRKLAPAHFDSASAPPDPESRDSGSAALNVSCAEDVKTAEGPEVFLGGALQVAVRHHATCQKYVDSVSKLSAACDQVYAHSKKLLDEGTSSAKDIRGLLPHGAGSL